MLQLSPSNGSTTSLPWLLATAAHASSRMFRPARSPRVHGLALAMPRPLHAPPPSAADICRGIWTLAGHEVHAAGNIIFDMRNAASAWLRELHGFGWIFPLLDGGQRLWLLRARTLLLDWLERAHERRLPAMARQPEVIARRLIHWTAAAAALLHDADEEFRKNLLHGLASHLRQVQRPPAPTLPAFERLMVLLARAWATLALIDDLATRERVLQELATEMQQQFLPDGGHISRAPAQLLDILGIVLPLRSAVESAGLALPAALQQIIDRALPMLRMLTHADDGLALFHGGRDTHHFMTKQVLEHDTIAGAPLDLAPHSGYARLACGDSVAIVDVGSTPHPLANANGALSALAMEFSAHGRRIITSCGLPFRADAELDAAARLSAAHSMPVLMDDDAGTLHDSGILPRLIGSAVARGPQVQAQCRHTEHGMLLEASHDAWLAATGLRTMRRLYLSTDGNDLRGEDSFMPASDASPAAPVPFTIRFHLHPAVRASLARDGSSVLLVLPDRSSWTFTARHALLGLEESILLAGRNGPRRSTQIVLRGQCDAQGCRINWRLHRRSTGTSTRRHRRKTATPTLPLPE